MLSCKLQACCLLPLARCKCCCCFAVVSLPVPIRLRFPIAHSLSASSHFHLPSLPIPLLSLLLFSASLPLLFSSLLVSPSRQLITYFPKINMHCKLRCKTHLRAALPTATAAETTTSTATALHLRLSNSASRRQLWQCQCQFAGAGPVIVNRSVCVHATLWLQQICKLSIVDMQSYRVSIEYTIKLLSWAWLIRLE